jgi:acetyl-CoA synthetase
LGAAVAPKEIDFRPFIPKNRAGKIMRRLLKAQELGLPEGDTSTLEPS